MLTLAFILAASALVLQGILLPRLSLFAFAPYLALGILRCEKGAALWLCAAAGALADLFSDDPMGLHALNYTITASLLFRMKKHFLYDQPFHLALFTAVVSAVSTALQLILLFLFDRRVPFDGRWVFSDLIGMPALDALYAFVWFAAPLSLFNQLKRIWVLFWLKKKNRSLTSH